MENNPRAIAAKLSRIAQEIGRIQKDAKNNHQKYKYTSAALVYDKVREKLAEAGIGIMHSSVQVVDMQHQDGNRCLATVSVKLILVDSEDGSTATLTGLGQGADKGDKAIMKAQTAATKYALAVSMLLSWGDDPEADESTDSPKASKSKKKSTKTAAAIIKEVNAASTPEEVDSIARGNRDAYLALSPEDQKKVGAASKAAKAKLS